MERNILLTLYRVGFNFHNIICSAFVGYPRYIFLLLIVYKKKHFVELSTSSLPDLFLETYSLVLTYI